MIGCLLACLMPVESVPLPRLAERIYGWSGGVLAVSIPDAAGQRAVMSVKHDGKSYTVSSVAGGDTVGGVDWRDKPVLVEQLVSGFDDVLRSHADVFVSRSSLLFVNKDSALLSTHRFEAIGLRHIDTRFVGLTLASGPDGGYLVISGSNIEWYGAKDAAKTLPPLRDPDDKAAKLTFPWLAALDSPIGMIGLFEAAASDGPSALPKVTVDEKWTRSGRKVQRLYLGVADVTTGLVRFRAQVLAPTDENAHMKPARHSLAYVSDWASIVLITAHGLAIIRT